eukprot:564777-Prymnesium_polylepis.1
MHYVQCGCPIWDLPFVPAWYGAQSRGRLLGPRDFSPPLTGVTAYVRPAERPPPRGHIARGGHVARRA